MVALVVLATYLIRAIYSPKMWSFVYRDLSYFVIFIPVYSGYSMFISPGSVFLLPIGLGAI